MVRGGECEGGDEKGRGSFRGWQNNMPQQTDNISSSGSEMRGCQHTQNIREITRKNKFRAKEGIPQWR